jgi:two-component system, LytTR family, sensor kinase
MLQNMNLKLSLKLWALFLTYSLVADFLAYPRFFLLDELVYVLIHMWIFYSTLYFLFFKEKIRTNFFLAKKSLLILVSIFGFLFLDYLYRYHFKPFFDLPKINPKELDVQFFLVDAVIWYMQFFLFAAGYFYSQKAFQKKRELIFQEESTLKLKEQKFLLEMEKQEQKEQNLKLYAEKLQLQQANLLLEKKQIETENAYLRAQINPHFLHNTLNFFFSKSLNAGAPDLAEAIMVLSDVMRFSLEAKPDENGRVVAAKELEHFNNVIKINEIRFSKKYVIDYKVEGDMEKVKIIPLVLITMVENAFKYGELFDPQNPLQIHISAVNNQFRFHLRNKKRTGGTPEPSHGIGVANSIQRLRAAYGEDGYSITIEQDEVFYAVTFVINDTTYVAPAVLSEATSKYESELATSTN